MSIEALLGHISKPNSNMDSQLVSRLIQSGYKHALLQDNQLNCLKQLETRFIKWTSDSQSISQGPFNSSPPIITESQDETSSPTSAFAMSRHETSTSDPSKPKHVSTKQQEFEQQNSKMEDLYIMLKLLQNRVQELEHEIVRQ